ncbi:hypothetical protein [Rhizomonospora bruguierae]|uniref:hypothetical protein n=1 Tax=Rhizomonospora bruguierae TaxID=1581705 RepID=UPI001BD14EE2|nr:hypothetical protein [Micromonospora sp. NBRC 107566]
MATRATGTYDPVEHLDSDIDVDLDDAPHLVPMARTTTGGRADSTADSPSAAGLAGAAGDTGAGRSAGTGGLTPGQRPYAMLRLPGIHDPAPHPHRLLGMCAWATALGVVGLAVAVNAMFTIIADTAAWWFQPAVVSAGLVGIGLAAGAFMAVHRRRLPWLMLAAATAMLALTIALASAA